MGTSPAVHPLAGSLHGRYTNCCGLCTPCRLPLAQQSGCSKQMSHSRPAGSGSACRPPLSAVCSCWGEGTCGLMQPLNNAGSPAGFAGVDASGSGALCCCHCQGQHSLQRTSQRCSALLMQAAKTAGLRSTAYASSRFTWPGGICAARCISCPQHLYAAVKRAIRHPVWPGVHLCPAAAQHVICKSGRWWSDTPCCAGEALRAATCASVTRPQAQASPRIEAGTSVPCQPVEGRPGSRNASRPSSRQAPGDLQPHGELHVCS